MTENTVPLSKSEKNKVLFGVAGGIGEYFNIDPNIIRIAFVLFTMIGGSGLVAYIAAAILMPEYQEAGSPESERKAPVDSGNTILIIGAVLVIIGIFYLLREAHFYFLPFWIENWIWRISHIFNFWGILLILFGLILLLKYRSKPEESSRNLVKLKSNKKIGGVCGGLGRYLGIDPTIVRIVFILFFIFASMKIAIITYLILLILMPEEKTT